MTSFNTVADKPYGDGEESRDELSIPPGPRFRLEPLCDHESVWLLLQYFDGIRSTIVADDVKRVLALANGDLCLEVDHPTATEYLWINNDLELRSRAVTESTIERSPVEFDCKELQKRIDGESTITIRETSTIPIAGEGVRY